MSGELVVRGGTGGTAAQLEDLDLAATRLHRSAAALSDAVGALRVGRSLLDGLREARDHLGAAIALDADVLAVHADLVVAGDTTRALGEGVVSAVTAYRVCEERNQALWFVGSVGAAVALAPLGAVLREVLPPVVPLAGSVAQQRSDAADADAADADAADADAAGEPQPPASTGPAVAVCAPGELGRALPATGDPQRASLPGSALRESVAGPSQGVSWCVQPSSAPPGSGMPHVGVRLPDGSPQVLAALLGTAVAGLAAVGARSAVPAAARFLVAREAADGFGDSTRVAATPVPVTAAVATQGPPRGVADLLARTGGAADTTTGPAGRVRVERVHGAGGRTASIVYLPGVEDWEADSRNPISSASALRAEGGLPSAYSDLVAQALDGAGADRGEPVMLVGHSLGGIVAAQVAGEPAVRDRFHVTAVVTAGSLIGAFDVPRDVTVLALEHPDDAVPGLDGADAPDAPNTITVIGATPSGDDPHSIEAYTATGAQVDASHQPSVEGWRELVAPFLAAPGAVSVVTEVSGRTVDPTPPGVPR